MSPVRGAGVRAVLAAVVVLTGLLVPLPAAAGDGIQVGALTVNDRISPLGIGGEAPHFGWVSISDEQNVVQSAYELRVGETPESGEVWTSGRVASARQFDIAYEGPALRSQTRYFWQVRVWDGAGRESRWSEPAWFETGLFGEADWGGAAWLTDHDEALGWADYTVDTELSLKALAAGVFFRAPDGQNGYLWQLSVADGTGLPKLRVHNRINGTYHLLAIVDISAAVTREQLLTGRTRFTVGAAGETVTTSVNGTRVDQRAVADFAAGTFGYRVVNASEGQEKAVIHRATVTGADGTTLTEVDFADGRNPFSGGIVGPEGLDLSATAEVLYRHRPSLPLYRKQFVIPAGKEVKQARAYGAALGVYELSLNGVKVGDHELAPGWTDYRTRVQHQTYDITAQVHEGANAFGIALAPGWYAGRVGNHPPGVYGSDPAVVAQLRVDYTDGSHDWVRTDTSWRTAPGPFVLADLQRGETYDARLARPGWNNPGHDESAWTTPDTAEPATARVVPQPDEPVRETERKPAIARTEPKPGTFVYDLGQNLVGVPQLRLTGTAGQTATIRHGEVLNPDGTLYTENLRGAAATDRYVFAADGPVDHRPTFTQHGFRYVEITGVTPPAVDEVEGVVWGSDLRETGGLTTSDPMLNQLQSNITWGQRGNFLSVPTDTPARDERLGWTGDINVFAPTASYNQDTRAFLRKWLGDLRATQRENGDYSCVAPDPANAGPGGVGWSDAGITVPYALFQAYGDTATVREHYPSMKRFFEFVRGGAGPDLIDDGRGRFEDWLNLNDPTPSGVLGTAYFAENARMLSEMARALGEQADADTYFALSGEIRAAFTRTFVNGDGVVSGGSQTAYALALGMNLVPAELRAKVADRFVEKIDSRGGALTTGFLGTPWLLPALSGSDRFDRAYGLLMRQEYPSWGYEVKMGATTMWERWNSINPDGSFGDPAMNSFNHYAYGAVGQWMYQHIGGISALEPGYHRSRIAPRPGGGLTSGAGSFDSAYGPVKSSWSNDSGGFRLSVDVPVNTTAEVEIPAASASAVTGGEAGLASSYADGVLTVTVGSGHHEFQAPRIATTG
ncbi:family 78 glycoside hydrolase catalytic domain [Amycolatopsis magusensis]|uniref:family 78 glycoside hydrolase catalytic domain n=1 Tax=Amycolatopsis magusensis TaxID=882444 RepID=UPI003C2EE745